MYFRPAILLLFAMLVFACSTGCQKSPTSLPAASPTVLSSDTVASVHWVGKRRLDLAADAYFFSRVWSLPETERLQSQAFDRLSTSLWRQFFGNVEAVRIPTGVLHPLFDELAQQESYLEIRAATGVLPSFVLATRVSERYAGIWETNTAIAAQLITGRPAIADPAIHGWRLRLTNAPVLIVLNHVGDWTLISAGPEQNSLFSDIAARIRHDGVPFVSSGTNLWLEGNVEVPRVAAMFPLSPSVSNDLEHLTFSLSGDGGNVITRAKAIFAQPFAAALPDWQIPLELIHEPLGSFTAVRGFQSWLAGWNVWPAVPDELFLWSLAGSPYQVYLAAPLPEARQQVAALTDHLLQSGNPWLAARGYISFDRAPDGNGVTWGNLSDIKPFIKSAGPESAGWLFAGLLTDTNSAASPPPAGMIQDILRRTNLVYYDWEVTGPRLPPSLELAQSARLITRQPQLPMGGAGVHWLAALGPRLGTAATIVNRTGSVELTLYRRSTLGLTAAELQLLTGWIESP